MTRPFQNRGLTTCKRDKELNNVSMITGSGNSAPFDRRLRMRLFRKFVSGWLNKSTDLMFITEEHLQGIQGATSEDQTKTSLGDMNLFNI